MLSVAALVSTIREAPPAALAASLAAVLGVSAWLLLSAPSSPSSSSSKSQRPARTTHRLPGSLPVLGDLLEIAPNENRFHDWMLDWCEKFDFAPWTVQMPGLGTMHMLSSPELFEDVLTTQFSHFPKGQSQRELVRGFFGNSVVASDGERWFHQRKAAVKFFSARTLRAYMATSARRNLLHVMDLIAAQQEQGTPVNLTNLFLDFTMQTFVETGLGVELDWIGRATPHPFQHAIDEAAELLITRTSVPAWLWKLQRWLNVGHEAAFARHMDFVVSWLNEIVAKSLENIATKKAQRLQSQDSRAEEIKSMVELYAEQSREDTDGIRAEDLVDFIQVMVIAARDTTAIALSWFFYELSKNPQVEERIRAELSTVFPDHAGKRDAYISAEDARALVFMEAALKEALRLHPPGPMMYKEAADDVVIGSDLVVRKGELVGLSAYCSARNPHVWGPDAAEYKPERWIDDATAGLRQFSSAKFVPFSSGPRACVGMSLAMLELRVVAANLLSRFRFELDENLDGAYLRSPLLPMKSPLIAKIHAV